MATVFLHRELLDCDSVSSERKREQSKHGALELQHTSLGSHADIQTVAARLAKIQITIKSQQWL